LVASKKENDHEEVLNREASSSADEKKPTDPADVDVEEAKKKKQEKPKELQEIENEKALVADGPKNAKFHAVMAAAAMYMAMVLTNWSNYALGDPNAETFDLGYESMWIKIAGQWLTIAVYLWTLLAPYTCLQNREFA